jgi:hypothetical protein
VGIRVVVVCPILNTVPCIVTRSLITSIGIDSVVGVHVVAWSAIKLLLDPVTYGVSSQYAS